MLRVVLDTNAIWSDPFLVRLPGQIVRDQARRGQLELIVPEVVVRETRNHEIAKLRGIAEQFEVARSKLSGHGSPPPIPVVDVEAAIAEFESHLRGMIEECGGRVLPFPAVDEAALFDRAARHVRPFKETGEGVQDALIWLGVLAAARDADPLVFVSNDKAAFAQKGGLHEQLASDVAAAGLPAGRILLVDRLTSFVREHVPEVAQQVVTFNDTVERDADFRADVGYALGATLEQPADYPVDLALPLLEDSFSSVGVVGIDLGRIAATIGVPVPKDASVALQIEAEASLRFEYPVYVADTYLEPEGTFESLSADSFLHERYASAVRREDVLADFEALYEPREGTLEDVLLVNLRSISDAQPTPG